jgi:hypothetical protein
MKEGHTRNIYIWKKNLQILLISLGISKSGIKNLKTTYN